MKRQGILMILIVFILTSCKSKSDEYVYTYVKLEDINSEDIQEIELEFELEGSPLFIEEMSDGYICATYKKSEKPNQDPIKLKQYYYTPIIRKLDKNYKIIWEKQFDGKGHVEALQVRDDDSFILTVDLQCRTVIGYDKDGNKLWSKIFNDKPEVMLTDSGDIAVCENRYAYNDTFMTKIDKNGNIVYSKALDGSGTHCIAEYNGDIGILVQGYSNSTKSNLAGDKGENNFFVACINEKDFEVKWLYDSNKSYGTKKSIYMYDDKVYLTLRKQDNFLSKDEYWLVILDNNGKECGSMKYDPDSDFLDWGNCVTILDNKDIIVGSSEIVYNGFLIIFDHNGKRKKIIKDLKYPLDTITPTDDGGFIVKSQRTIGNIPTPAVLSTIWTDTEVVIVKYNSDYEVEWRKTYDKYKDSKLVDCIIPLRDGRVIVEAQ
ncbi:PQQ-binding-like beta-propeller repeat protein [Vallitalea maricola]|uniref:Uncharacterized protein n=1 Tax=Vallitalea maricola TaxID=3074433 RepID=A0ACB5UFZ6_9FIRM|nr:hypothetical protein AN2V17_08950 [Vallitalea sp. AN17-2]